MPILFPVDIRSTCFGVVNIFARFVTVLSPIMAEESAPTPMVIYGCLAAVCALGSLSLKEIEDEKKTVVEDLEPLLDTKIQ